MTFVEWNHHEIRLTRQRAVELFADQIDYAKLEKQETITLPIFAAKVILGCALDGQHRGQGRHRPRDSERDRVRKKTVAQWTRERAVELEAKGMKQSRAKDKAAQEAQAKYGKHTGHSTGYIRRKAYSKS